jgi:histidinol-phosphate aminotransferase
VTRVPVRDDLSALEGYHSPQVDVRVRLNTNEAPVAPPAAFRQAYAEAVAKIEWHRYPDRGATALRAAIAELHGVDPAMVFVANGSNEVLQTILLTFSGFGRTVATFEPTYQMHGQIARSTGATEVRQVITESRPHVTFLCSPNNPTGGVDSPELVREVLALNAGPNPGLVVVDEAYGQFADWSALELVSEETPLVVTRTFSKTWSMAAARLGYLIGPKWLVAELDKVVLPYHLDTAKQIAGTLAVQYRGDMEERVRMIVAERERVVATLKTLDIEVFPSGANFVLFRTKSKTGRAVWQGLLDRSVLIRDCSGWPRLENCLRVTIGTPEEDDAFLVALTEVLK